MTATARSSIAPYKWPSARIPASTAASGATHSNPVSWCRAQVNWRLA